MFMEQIIHVSTNLNGLTFEGFNVKMCNIFGDQNTKIVCHNLMRYPHRFTNDYTSI